VPSRRDGGDESGAVVFSYEGEASSRTIANLVIIDQYEAEAAEAAPAIKEAA